MDGSSIREYDELGNEFDCSEGIERNEKIVKELLKKVKKPS
jgi:hypothetical protein